MLFRMVAEISKIIVNHFGAETRLSWDNWVSTMAADGLAPCVASKHGIDYGR